MMTRSQTEGTTRYHPRSPGARLSALRRARREEDEARERLLAQQARVEAGLPAADLMGASAALVLARQARMEAEREFWEARAGHGLD